MTVVKIHLLRGVHHPRAGLAVDEADHGVVHLGGEGGEGSTHPCSEEAAHLLLLHRRSLGGGAEVTGDAHHLEVDIDVEVGWRRKCRCNL